jgi:hypothetical protein
MRHETDRWFRPAIAAALAVAAVLTIVLCAARARSVAGDTGWAQTTGYEAGTVNLVYRQANGIRPYGDLDADPTPGIFNALFYTVYGAVARPLRTDPVSMLRALRLFSLAIAVTASCILSLEIARVLRASGETATHARIAAGAVATTIVLGPFVGWWALTVRPDIAVLAAEAAALAAARRALDARRHTVAWAAVIAVAVAWGFKQNALSVWFALFALAPAPRWRNRAALVAALVALFAVFLAYEGRHYFTHAALMAVGGPKVGLQYLWSPLTLALVVGGPCLLLPFLELPAAWRRSAASRFTAVVFVLSLVVGCAQLLRAGASRNYLTTCFLAGGLLLVDGIRDSASWPRWRRFATAAGALYLAALPAAYLVAPDRAGRITIDAVDEASTRVRIAAMHEAPGPRYVEDNMDALPWHSGQAMIETIDGELYFGAVREGLITVTIEDRARRGHYGSAFLTSERWRAVFERAGYVKVTMLPGNVLYYRRPAG